jgi:hypothetical protein
MGMAMTEPPTLLTATRRSRGAGKVDGRDAGRVAKRGPETGVNDLTGISPRKERRLDRFLRLGRLVSAFLSASCV